jgi:hypothetical protein
LGEKSLEQYLREKWLKDALPFISPEAIDVTPELEKELAKLFNSGEVLLLLDGVDEMPAPSPVQALAKIREELTGWDRQGAGSADLSRQCLGCQC